MRKIVRAYTTANQEEIKVLCDQMSKEYTQQVNKHILIEGEHLDGILDIIRMNGLGEVVE